MSEVDDRYVHVYKGRLRHVSADDRRMRTFCGQAWVARWLDESEAPLCRRCIRVLWADPAEEPAP